MRDLTVYLLPAALVALPTAGLAVGYLWGTRGERDRERIRRDAHDAGKRMQRAEDAERRRADTDKFLTEFRGGGRHAAVPDQPDVVPVLVESGDLS